MHLVQHNLAGKDVACVGVYKYLYLISLILQACFRHWRLDSETRPEIGSETRIEKKERSRISSRWNLESCSIEHLQIKMYLFCKLGFILNKSLVLILYFS